MAVRKIVLVSDNMTLNVDDVSPESTLQTLRNAVLCGWSL